MYINTLILVSLKCINITKINLKNPHFQAILKCINRIKINFKNLQILASLKSIN